MVEFAQNGYVGIDDNTGELIPPLTCKSPGNSAYVRITDIKEAADGLPSTFAMPQWVQNIPAQA